MIKLLYNDEIVRTEFFTFPDGTRHVKILEKPYAEEDYNHIFIFAQASSSDDIMDILLLNDAVERHLPADDKFLYIPYMLGSRQDRVMVDGEPLSVKVYANLINSCNFNRVYTLDSHSVATGAALNDMVSFDIESNFYDEINIKNSENAIVISPDAGAVKRVTKFAKTKGISKLVKADKTRDLATGKITDFELYANQEDIFDKHVYIVDDIVTNGGTFLGLLKELEYHNPRSVSLVVTHADTYDGLLNMCENFHMVYVTNSKSNYEDNESLRVIDIFNGVMK